ncbi:hypothetical protein ACI2I2_19865 [Scandinavium sp. NPDC088450]|uniref:hypothetical protein n=1 Tax=Scandinavium sp. NPDC088450 TaxID=3364514 RepID=UPI00384DE682
MHAYISINGERLMAEDYAQSVRQAAGYFNRYYRYPVERLAADYQDEIRKYSDDRWEAPQRAARLSAAVKNYKTSQMLIFIFDIGIEKGMDLTPLAVKRLCNSLFGRTESQSIIVDVFGQRGRSHRSSDSTIKVIDEVASKYRYSAGIYWSATLKDIEQVKREYRKNVRRDNQHNEKAEDK